MLRINKQLPFDEDIEKATSENNLTDDWSLIMQICDRVVNYSDGAKLCLKAIMKRMHHNVPRVALQTLTLLDACVKNCDRAFLLQVASSEFTNEVRKLLGKVHPEVATKLKEMLQRWSTEEFKDDPELCIIPSLYYKLKSEGVTFPSAEPKKKPTPINTDPNVVTSQEEENDIIKAIEISLKDTGRHSMPAAENYSVKSESSSTTLPDPIKVRALYDFDAAEDNELTIKSGEIVLVTDNSNASWWKGSNHRGIGLFPSNFVTEDLEQESTETSSVLNNTIDEADTTFMGEVRLSEEKIETCLNWLNETDPTIGSPDPSDMLRLEDECYKMTPLIEDNLQMIDKRLAMLNNVNDKIMASFDLFHGLSDGQINVPQSLKYATLQNVMNMPPANMQVPIHSMGSHTLPRPDMHPVAPNSQYDMATSPLQTNMMPTQTSSSENLSAASVGNSVETQQPASYEPNAMGGYYGQPAMGYSPMYRPQLHPPNTLPSAVIPGTMSFPQSLPTMGHYIPHPGYYINSNLPASMDDSKMTNLSNNSENVQSAQTFNPTIPITTQPNSMIYPTDVNHIITNNVNAVSADQIPQAVTNTSD